MWRNHENHKQETKAVKAALLGAGIDVLSVKHGTGTAYAWLEITLHKPIEEGCEKHGSGCVCRDYECPACNRFMNVMRTLRENTIQVAQQVTGRHGEYNGDISVDWYSWL